MVQAQSIEQAREKVLEKIPGARALGHEKRDPAVRARYAEFYPQHPDPLKNQSNLGLCITIARDDTHAFQMGRHAPRDIIIA